MPGGPVSQREMESKRVVNFLQYPSGHDANPGREAPDIQGTHLFSLRLRIDGQVTFVG